MKSWIGDKRLCSQQRWHSCRQNRSVSSLLGRKRRNSFIRLQPKRNWVSFYHTMQLCERGLGSRNSVCLSVTHVLCDKTKQCSADILIPHERVITLVFWHQQWLVDDASFHLKSYTLCWQLHITVTRALRAVYDYVLCCACVFVWSTVVRKIIKNYLIGLYKSCSMLCLHVILEIINFWCGSPLASLTFSHFVFLNGHSDAPGEWDWKMWLS